MVIVYDGKTKTVYKQDDGNYVLKFKDDLTGVDGVFDPGANTVGLSIEGAGKAGLRLTDYFFRKIQDSGIMTHYVSADVDNAVMTVRPATQLGNGLEVICRFKAAGSFVRRYGAYAPEGMELNAFVEVTIKDDARQDPPISKDALDMLSVLTADEYEELKAMTQRIAGIVKDDLMTKGMELIDIKLEFGRIDGNIALIDEISGGNMRVSKGGKIVGPMDLVDAILQ